MYKKICKGITRKRMTENEKLIIAVLNNQVKMYQRELPRLREDNISMARCEGILLGLKDAVNIVRNSKLSIDEINIKKNHKKNWIEIDEKILQFSRLETVNRIAGEETKALQWKHYLSHAKKLKRKGYKFISHDNTACCKRRPNESE